MIVEKVPLPDVDEADLPDSAPPAYDSLTTSSSNWNAGEKAGPSQASSTSCQPLSSPSSVSSLGSKKQRPSGWFPFFSSSRAAALEVKETVSGLIREIVKNPESTAPVLIFDSCAEACRAHNLSLASLLQEPSIEGHSPIYWAIIKRRPEPPKPGEQDLITALLVRAAPLTDATISEIRLACLQSSDHVLFQRLRQMRAFAPISGAEEMLLGSSGTSDQVIVEEVPGDEGAFVAHFRIVMFQRRMRISKEINLEFIARGRLWSFKFFVVQAHDARVDRNRQAPPVGTWALALSLMEHSPPTWIDSRLVIEEARPVPPDPSTSPGSAPKAQDSKSKPKPTISLRLKSGSAQLTALGRGYFNNIISVSLEDSLMANSLQYTGSSYIAADESLQARLEARLAKPEAECIIC